MSKSPLETSCRDVITALHLVGHFLHVSTFKIGLLRPSEGPHCLQRHVSMWANRSKEKPNGHFTICGHPIWLLISKVIRWQSRRAQRYVITKQIH